MWSSPKHRVWQVLILLASVVVCVPRNNTPLVQAGLYLIMAPLFTALVTALAFSPSFWLVRLLSWSPLTLIGAISYEIYLSHVVVYRVLNRAHLDRWLTVYYAVSILLAIAVGWLFHRIIGKPSQRWARAWLSGRVTTANT